MWLLICDPSDDEALWARAGLQDYGLTPFEVLTADDFTSAQRWIHRISEGGSSISEVRLQNDAVVRSDTVTGVLNRLRKIPSWGPMERAAKTDQLYAAAEVVSFFVSWLYAFPRPMLNVPSPSAFAGRARHWSEWVRMAQVSGLKTRPLTRSSEETANRFPALGEFENHQNVIVVGKETIGADLSIGIREACGRLAAISETPLLGVRLAYAEGAWCFAGASTHPDLRPGGTEVIAALAQALSGNEP